MYLRMVLLFLRRLPALHMSSSISSIELSLLTSWGRRLEDRASIDKSKAREPCLPLGVSISGCFCNLFHASSSNCWTHQDGGSYTTASLAISPASLIRHRPAYRLISPHEWRQPDRVEGGLEDSSILRPEGFGRAKLLSSTSSS